MGIIETKNVLTKEGWNGTMESKYQKNKITRELVRVGNKSTNKGVVYNNDFSTFISPILRIPIDKIYIRSPSGIATNWLEPFKKFDGLPHHKGYQESAVYKLPNGARVVIYNGINGCEFQVNPTEWESYNGLFGFLERCFGEQFSETWISRLHLDVIVRRLIDLILYGIWVKRKSLSKKFSATVESRKSGHLAETALMHGFGSEKGECVVLYDAAKKHGFLAPATKIEIRGNNHRSTIIRQFQDLPSLLQSKIFSDRIELKELTPLPNLTDKQRKKLAEFMAMAGDVGIGVAKSYFRNPKNPGGSTNFDRDFEKIITLRPMSIDLDALFHADLKGFLDQTVSPIELQLISLADISKIPNQYVPGRKRVMVNPESRANTYISQERRYFASMAANLAELSRLTAKQTYYESKVYSDATHPLDDIGIVQQSMALRKSRRIERLKRIQLELMEIAYEEGWDAPALTWKLDNEDEDYFSYPDIEEDEVSE